MKRVLWRVPIAMHVVSIAFCQMVWHGEAWRAVSADKRAIPSHPDDGNCSESRALAGKSTLHRRAIVVRSLMSRARIPEAILPAKCGEGVSSHTLGSFCKS